jgi:hypothetical protein
MGTSSAVDFRNFPLLWASHISVKELGGEQLLVKGQRDRPEPGLERRDVFLQYRSSLRSEFAQKNTSQNSPHVRFANAHNDDQLIAFLRDFGAFSPCDAGEFEGLPETDWAMMVYAIEELPILRREQRTYAAALRLLTEIKVPKEESNVSAIKESIEAIADGIAFWPEQWEAESKWLKSHVFSPIGWHFDRNHRDYIWRIRWRLCPPEMATEPTSVRSVDLDWRLQALKESAIKPIESPHRAAHLVLCELLNAFATQVQCFGDCAIETIPHVSVLFGIRPAMYFILRHEYLGSTGIRVCHNNRCRRFFESWRSGQRFCSAECSQKFRQRKYWRTSGTDLRHKRKLKKQLE